MLEFICDLASPQGPDPSVGISGPMDALRWKARDQSGDDILFAEEKVEQYVANWASRVNQDAYLRALFEIAANPPPRSFYDDFYARRLEDWNFWVFQLIYYLGSDRVAYVRSLINQYRESDSAKPIIEDLDNLLREEWARGVYRRR